MKLSNTCLHCGEMTPVMERGEIEELRKGLRILITKCGQQMSRGTAKMFFAYELLCVAEQYIIHELSLLNQLANEEVKA